MKLRFNHILRPRDRIQNGDGRMTDLRIAAKAFISLSLMMAMALNCQAANTPEELEGDVIEIGEIYDEFSAFEDEMVIVEGEIVYECGSGCWFVLDDETGSIFVDIFPSNFVIPQERGSEAKVYGRLSSRDNSPFIIGEIVEIDGEIYR